MATPEAPFGPSLVTAAQMAEGLVQRGFKETDMQFNIGRIEGQFRMGFDVINPSTKDRLYITGPSSGLSEKYIRGVMGDHSVLELADRKDNLSVYKVPRGTRLLHKTLRSGPYTKPYMQSLGIRALTFLQGLERLDSQAFGVDTSQLALTHNGSQEADDVYLTVVPPLREPVYSSRVTYENVGNFIRRQKASNSLGKFAVEGVMGKLPQKPNLDTAFYEKYAAYDNKFDLKLIMKYFDKQRPSDD